MTALEVATSNDTLDPRRRYLPGTMADGYQIGGYETLAAALHRVTTEQFTVAIDALTNPDADTTVTATTALRAIKRIMAVLRMVRSAIGDAAYRTELNVLRDTAGRLDAVLEGQPEVLALDRLAARYETVLLPGAFDELRQHLVQRHQLRRLHAISEGDILEVTLHSLRRARARFAAWPVEGDTARMYGRDPIDDAFTSIEPGLTTTYKRARRHWERAADVGLTGVAADWRRETQRLGYQLDLLATVWPDVMGATASACAQLDAVLTESDDFAALGATLAAHPGFCPDRVVASLLEALIAGAASELGHIASILGARLYVEPTDLFLARLSAYWDARGL